MGNRKFKFSEMIPNAWFYKLREMGTRNHQHHQQQSRRKKNPTPPPPQEPPHKEPCFSKPHQDSVSHTRKSYYFSRDLNPKSPDLLIFPTLDPPRKSSKKTRPTTKKRPTFTPTPTSTTKSSSSSSSAAGDETCIVIDVDNKSLGWKMEDSASTPHLPPIRTERNKFNGSAKEIGGTEEAAIDAPIKKKKKSSVRNESFSAKVATEEEDSMASSVFKEQGIRPVRRFPTGSPRFRIRVNSPRIARRAQVSSSKGIVSRKSISSDSLAVVKSSCDPKRDFRESMVEMIVENNIRAPKELEELLACYLSLNSDEYHDVIIQVFKQIWFDLNKIRGLREVVA